MQHSSLQIQIYAFQICIIGRLVMNTLSLCHVERWSHYFLPFPPPTGNCITGCGENMVRRGRKGWANLYISWHENSNLRKAQRVSSAWKRTHNLAFVRIRAVFTLPLRSFKLTSGILKMHFGLVSATFFFCTTWMNLVHACKYKKTDFYNCQSKENSVCYWFAFLWSLQSLDLWRGVNVLGGMTQKWISASLRATPFKKRPNVLSE